MRQRVKVEQKHLDRYIELHEGGTSIEKALFLVQKEFGLDLPHTGEAVRQKMRKIGIKFSLGRKRTRRYAGFGTRRYTEGAVNPPKGNGYHDRLAKLDDAVEALIKMAEVAKEVTTLRDENWKLKNEVAALRNELDMTRRSTTKETEKDQRYRLALQQGDINPPVGGVPGKCQLSAGWAYGSSFCPDDTYVNASALSMGLLRSSYLTYHINHEPSKFTLKDALEHNIIIYKRENAYKVT